jgi:hypothetical protein
VIVLRHSESAFSDKHLTLLPYNGHSVNLYYSLFFFGVPELAKTKEARFKTIQSSMMTATTICLSNRDQKKFAQGKNVKVFHKMEPPQKKVRFSGISSHTDDDEVSNASSSMIMEGAHSPGQVEQLMEKVRKRAARRKREKLRSPPPPSDGVSGEGTPAVDSSAATDEDDLQVMQRKLRRIEHAIKESARIELKLMNKSKKLRERRTLMTHKYESMASQLRHLQRLQNPHGPIFQMGKLPPLLEKPRRVSATGS